jgi:Zn finger protein HypA/HybF involved in hydrogenase expression
MAAIFECLECGHSAIYSDERDLNNCPECGDVHTDVTYGVPVMSKVKGQDQPVRLDFAALLVN